MAQLTHKTPVIAIIGGGFSGTMTAIQLSRMADIPLQIIIVNAKNPFAKGTAFSTHYDFHLLNVKAGRMSAFPEDKDNFVDWLHAQEDYKTFDRDWLKQQFIPRKTYGQYLSFLLSEEIKKHNNIRLLHDEVTDIEYSNNSAAKITLQNEPTFYADKVVLALGNFLPSHPFSNTDFIHSRFYVHDPWRIRFSELTSSGLPVLLVGSGLTMVDIFLNLRQMNYSGKIYVLSRNGLLPAPHSTGEKFSFDDDVLKYSRLNELYPLIKRNLKKALESDDNLDGGLDVVRKNIQLLWQRLSINDKKQFLRHVTSKWNIVRHRIPASIHTKVHEAIKKGQLELLRGRIEKVEASEYTAVIKYVTPQKELKIINAIKVVNCTGPLIDYSKIDSSLIKNLIRRKYIQPHELNLGVEATPDCSVLEPNGKPSDFLYVIGNALTGVLWESVAVPELRQQAKTIAQNILNQVSYHKEAHEAISNHH